MKFRHLLLSAALMGALPALAATYYVSPEGSGNKDGSSFDNAFGVEEFRTQAANNANGDIYYLAGGTYVPSKTIVFKKETYATVNGNEGGERTVLSGDLNSDGVASEGDLNCILRFQTVTANGNNNRPFIISNIDFTSAYTNETKDDDNDDADGLDGIGALYFNNSGCVTVIGCRFYGNKAVGTLGGPALQSQQSTSKFIDCVFNDNSAVSRGGAARLRSSNVKKGVTVFENCIFKSNVNESILGGAVFMSHGLSVTFVNTTFADNTAGSRGAAVMLNSGKDYACLGTFISCTIAGNTATGDAKDAQIVSTQYANLRLVNTVIVSDNENTADILFESGATQTKFSFVSGGYNYVGTVVDNATVAAAASRAEGDRIKWLESDRFGAENTYASIFGTNKINADNYIKPVSFVEGASAEQLTAATKDWGLPADIDITKDSQGRTRNSGMSVGAYSETEENITTGIEDITADGASTITVHGNGVYSVAGAASVEAYSIAGCRVAAVAGDTIDLSGCQAGMYIVKAGKQVFKVIR